MRDLSVSSLCSSEQTPFDYYCILNVTVISGGRTKKWSDVKKYCNTRIGTLIVATIYLQLIQNRYIFRSFTVLQCSHKHCVQPVASDVEVVGYL